MVTLCRITDYYQLGASGLKDGEPQLPGRTRIVTIGQYGSDCLLCRGGRMDGEGGRPRTTTPPVISELESTSLTTTGPVGTWLGAADKFPGG